MGAGKGGNYGKDKGDDEEKIGRFADNLLDLIKDYALSIKGYFGTEAGKHVRHIMGSDPLETMRDFILRATIGAKITPMKNGKGFIARFSDGFEIDYRETSSSDGTPSITIWTPSRLTGDRSEFTFDFDGLIIKIRQQKIHFVKDKDDEEEENTGSYTGSDHENGGSDYETGSEPINEGSTGSTITGSEGSNVDESIGSSNDN